MSQNVDKDLPFNAAYYLRRAQISHDDLVMQVLVWLCMVQFGASNANLHDLTCSRCKFKEKNLILHSSKYCILEEPDACTFKTDSTSATLVP